MINQDKWIDSLLKTNIKFNEETNQIDHYRWINTISKKRTYNAVRKYSAVRKYTLITVLFVCGLLFVSVVKNQTRKLQKEINNLEASINVIKFNLDQAILDNEVITSPENISLLAKEYLNTNLATYSRSQIKQLNDETEKFTKVNKIKKERVNKKKIKNLSVSIKSQISKRIEGTKTDIRKIQQLYSNPKMIPNEVKTQVAKRIEEKKNGLKNIYNSPKDLITFEKAGKWSVIQIVKAFLGMPIMPGK